MRIIITIGFLILTSLVNGQEKTVLRFGHLHDNKLEIVELNKNHEISTLYSDVLSDSVPVCSKGNLFVFNTPGMSIYILGDNSFKDINESAQEFYIGEFYDNKNWFYYSRLLNEESDMEIVIYDYKNYKIEKVIEGFYPKLSMRDDCLYFMRAEIDSSNAEIEYKRFIYKFQPDSKEEELVTTVILSEYGKYDLTEVSGLDCSKYFYRVYDEHEYRYYSDWTGEEKEFYSGNHGHFSDGMNKEQYDLCFSPDGKYAAFAERNWNELTYIVLIDLVNEKRYELDMYGSFPVFFNQKLYFVSDPEIVSTTDVTFRQIKDYALYYVDLTDKKLQLVHDFEGGIQLIK